MQPVYEKTTIQFNNMPIIINLDVALAKRKMSLTDLSKKVNVTFANLSLLKTNTSKGVRFSTLGEICDALNCQPGEILQNISKERYRELLGRDPDHKLMD